MSENPTPLRQSNAGTANELRIGVVFPQTEIGNRVEDIRAFAIESEAMGYRHLLAYDHVVGGSLAAPEKLRNRYTDKSPFHETFVLLGFLAAATTTLEMVTGVLILPQRQTVLVAKQAAALDVLSQGRLRLGVGIGWNDIEFQALNESFGNRARRFEEQIALLRELWAHEVISFAGNWHTIDNAGIQPLPTQRPIPIWIGASAEAAIRRAARLADGFFPNARTIEDHQAQLATLRDELDRAGRSRETFGLEPRITLADGKPDDWRRLFSWWREQGATHLTMNTMGSGFTSVSEHLKALETALRTVETA